MPMGGQQFFITQQDIDKYEFLYVWGYVIYHDGFDGERRTNYCIRYNMNLFNPQSEQTGECVIPKEAGRYSHHYNDAT